METKVKRREWVKNFAIIFLAILLVLTFFSNTIMNRSLPEVAAQYVESGSINAKIRGTGAVSANEVYEVTLSQTRKIRSVKVKVGDEVTAGDTLFVLESAESDELKAAQDALDQMELDYQKNLITMSNNSSTENRQVEKLRKDYEDALEIYRIYSNMDPSKIRVALNDAQADLSAMQRSAQELSDELADAQAELSEAQSKASEILTQIADLENEIAAYEKASDDLQDAMDVLDRDRYLYESYYDQLESYAKQYNINYAQSSEATRMAAYAEDTSLLMQMAGITQEEANKLSEAYKTLTGDINAVVSQLGRSDALTQIEKETNFKTKYDKIEGKVKAQLHENSQNKEIMKKELERLQATSDNTASLEAAVKNLQEHVKRAQQAVSDQQAVVDNYQSASTAAATLEAAEEALEDAVFETSLGNTQNLDLQAAKEAIEEQKKLVEELTTEADGQEVVANVSGTISAINVTAGNTAGAEEAIAAITVADRGYTVKITVTADQARQVRVGDTAEITNYYWGDITATLENIANDPTSMGQNKVLIFRISGEGVEAGSNLTLSIGQKSANYDCLVPNSAIRSDSNGSFVLVVTAKSSPLGNRYVATRAEVQVLASDDTMSAVSGLANGDFVITTSTKPLEAGDQVRLADNG